MSPRRAIESLWSGEEIAAMVRHCGGRRAFARRAGVSISTAWRWEREISPVDGPYHEAIRAIEAEMKGPGVS